MHIRAVGATEIFFWKVANIFEGDGEWRHAGLRFQHIYVNTTAVPMEFVAKEVPTTLRMTFAGNIVPVHTVTSLPCATVFDTNPLC